MMNSNIFRFELRLSRLTLLSCSLGLFLFQLLLVGFYSAARPDESLAPLFKLIPKPILALVGGKYVDLLTVSGFLSYAFTHPINLILLSAGPILLASRSAPGRGDDAAADLVLSQPVSRTAVLMGKMAAGTVCSAGTVLCMWLGHLAGITFIPLPAVPDKAPFVFAAVNAFFFVLAVQGVAFLAAAASRLRTTAVCSTIAVLVVMLFLSFFAELWELFEEPARLSFFTYYIPGKIVARNALTHQDLTALACFFIVTSGTALWIFNRRDI